jgi:hypothetical protein
MTSHKHIVVFLHPLFLLSSFFTVDFNNIIYNEECHAKELQDFNNTSIFKGIKPLNLSSGYAKGGSFKKNGTQKIIM